MKKGNNRRFLTASVALVVLLSFVLGACGSSQTASSPTPTATARPTPTPTRVVIASPLVGDYASTITKADIPKNDPILSLVMLGHWEIIFANDGGYDVFFEGAPHTHGTYQVKQNQLTFTGDSRCIEIGQEFGLSDAGTGTYTWRLEGKMLFLKAVSDTCSPRNLVFSTHPWVKQG